MRCVVTLFTCLALLVPAVVRAQDEDKPLYKTKYRVINVHRHCDSPGAANVKAELEVMDRVGVSAWVNLLIGGGWSDARLPGWLELQKKNPDRLVVFGSINLGKTKDPDFFAGLVHEIEVQHRLGGKGVKVWKNLGMNARDADGKRLRVNDPRLDPFWKRCGELGMPVLIHVADPKEYWYPLTYNSLHYGMRSDKEGHFGKQDSFTWVELMDQRDNVLKKHPKTTFIGAHMGSLSFDLKRLADTFDKYPNFYVDTSARLRLLGRLNPMAIRDLFTKYQDRILFGTNSNVMSGVSNSSDEKAVKAWQDRAARFYSRHLEYFETDHLGIVEPYGYAKDWLRLTGVKLPPAVLEKLYHANAERLIPALKPAQN